MLYLFRAKDGSEVCVERHHSKAPPLGSKIKRKGKAYYRVIDLAPALCYPNIHFASHQMPLNWKNEKGEPFAKSGFDARGRSRFGSMKEVQEAISKAKHAGEPIHGYD